MDMADLSYREQKEAFVSGHSGTSTWEVSALAAVPVVLLILWRLLQHPAGSGGGLLHRGRPPPSALALDFAVLVLPQVSHLLGFVNPMTLLGICAALVAALFAVENREERQHRLYSAPRRPLTELLRDSLSVYRASLMLITCIAILGVDFHAFPRRFAKAETFGTGLMDAGVGSFVTASGLAHGLAAAAGRASTFRKEGVRALALVALGVGRLLVTAAAGYQHHASEYGLHWNFFFTLAVLRLFGMLLPWATRSGVLAAAAGGGLLMIHHWFMTNQHIIDIVHHELRGTDLLSANKEGLFSLLGYWALQLLATAAGHVAYRLAGVALPRPPSTGNLLGIRVKVAPAGRAPLRLLLQLAAGTAALWGAYWWVAAEQMVSRRACNAAYVLWMLALNAQCVVLFAAAEVALPGALPRLLEAVSASMLPVFLAANVLTGLINLSINTLAVSDIAALLLVSAYMALLCAAAAAALAASQGSQKSSRE